MYYYRVMGYDMHFPANQLGGPQKVWTIREYGLSQVWVKAEATVYPVIKAYCRVRHRQEKIPTLVIWLRIRL
jgi:hypothetical protein